MNAARVWNPDGRFELVVEILKVRYIQFYRWGLKDFHALFDGLFLA